MAKVSFGSGEFGGGQSFGSGGSFSGKSGNGERRSPSIVAESLDEERLKPYLEGYQEYLSTNPDDEEGAQLAGEDKLFTWENEHQSMLPLAGKVIQTGLKGVGINLPNIFEDYKGIPALQLGTGNTELNMDLESLSPEDQKKYIEGYTNYRNRHPDAKEDDLNAHLAGQSAVRSGWYENRWNKEPEESKEQKLPEFWMPGGATRFEDLAPDLIEQLKNPQEQSKESPFQFGAEQTEVTDEKVRSTLEKIHGQLSELNGNGTVQETYAMQADANALSDYLNGITDDPDSVRPILDKWNIGNYQNALGQNQQQEEQQSAFTFSAEQTEVTDDAVRGALSKIQERKAELGYNASEQQTYAMQADENALNDYLNGITDDPESVRPILEKWKAGNNLSELGKPEPNIWQKALTEKTMQDMRLVLGLLTGEDNIDLSQMNTPALDVLAGTASSAHEAIVNARNAFFASTQEGLLSAEESAAWLGFNLSTLLRLDGPVRALNEWVISNALGHDVDLSGFNLLSEGFEGWAGAAQNKQQLLQADSDALKEAARPEMESVFKQFMSEQDAKALTETILTDLVQGTGQTFGSMYPGMISMYTSAAGMLGGAGEASSFIGRIWDALRQPGSWSVFINEAGQATKEARQRYGEGITDWDLGMAIVTGLVNTTIENYETKLGRGIQSIIEGGSFPGLASLITSGLTEMLEEGKQKFTGDLNQDIADLGSGRALTHKLSFTEEEALFNVADYLDLCASTYVTSVGLGVTMGGANLAAKPYRTAVENVLNGTATPEEARMAAEAAEMAMADQEAQRQAGTVETPTTEEQHNTFENTANGNEQRPAPGGTDARAEAAVEEAGADAWDEEQDYKCEKFVLEELERAGAPQEQIDAQRAVVNEKLEAWNRAKAGAVAAPAPADAGQPAPIVPGELEFERARQEFLEERDKMLELERREAPQEELDAQQAILDQKKAAMDQLNPFSYTPPAREESNLPPAETSYTPPAREENNLPPEGTDVRTAEQRMREAQAAEVQAIIASNDPNVLEDERVRRAQEASDASARRAAAEEEYRRAQAAADAAIKNQNDQADLRSQEEQRAQQAQDEARKAELRLKRAQEARQQAEEAAKQQGLQARERAEAEKKAGIARRQERRAQEEYNKALKAAEEQNRQADARKADDDAAQNSIDQMNGLLQGEYDQTNQNAQDIVDDQNRQTAERLRLEEETRAAEQRMQEARAAEVQAIVATNNPDMPEEEREQREQEARDAIARREEAENKYREAQAAVDALGEFVPQEEPEQPEQPESNFTPQERPEDQKSELVPQDEPAKPEQPVGNFVPQKNPEEQKSELVNQEPPEKPEDQVSNLVNQEPPAKPDDQVGNLVPQEKPEEQKSDLVPMDEPAKPDDQVGTLVEDEAGEAGDGQGNAEEPKTEEPLSNLVETDEGEPGEGESKGSAGETPAVEEDESQAGEGEGAATITVQEDVDRTTETQQRAQQLIDDANRHAQALGFGTYNGKNTPGVQMRSWDGGMTEVQRAELTAMDQFARKHGFTVAVHSQLEGGWANGKYYADEGGGRVIHIAQDSENPLRTTMGHELYHMLTSLNPAGAQKVARVFEKWAARNGSDINEMIAEVTTKYRELADFRRLSPEQQRAYAYEEVVANSLLDVIGDEQSARALAMEDRGLAQRIHDWISRVMREIHDMLGNYAANSEEGRVFAQSEKALREMQETVRQALEDTDALKKSVKAGKSLGSNSRMLGSFVSSLDAATGFDESNAAAQRLAAGILQANGLEVNDTNMNTLMGIAQMAADGMMVSEAAIDSPLDGKLKAGPETNRAVQALGRYQVSLLENGQTDMWEKLYENGKQQTETDEKAITKEVSEDLPATRDERAITDRNGNELAEVDHNGTVAKLSYKSWNATDKAQVKKDLMDAGYSEAEVDKWIEDVNSVARYIAENKDKLDYTADQEMHFVKPNAEYKITIDASTLCAKRRLYQGIFDQIQKQLPNTALQPGDLTKLINMMNEKGLETPCSFCYVESRRKWLGRYAKRFLNKYEGEYKPSIEELTSTSGLAKLRREHRQAYDDFIADMNKKGTANPKVVQPRTDYRDRELLNLTPKTVEKILRMGGVRVQSFSDFETVHLIDMMQVVLDMSSMGLTSQAYTKVPNFAWVFGDTGIKINLSLVGKGTGLDENGKLVFDNKEGMDINEAMKLRSRYSKNVGTILVGINDAHILAAMADDRIDFIIPFHTSGWKKTDLKLNTLVQNYDTKYQSLQNERYFVKDAKGNYLRYANGKYVSTKISGGNLYPIDYWNYDLSGKENAEIYLKKCAEEGRIPKFYHFLVDNHDGSFSLQPDGSTDGYWKLLIDFKMYDNNGVKAPQTKVVPNINMEEAQRVLKEYDGNPNELPYDQDVVNQFVDDYKATHRGTKWSLKKGTDNGATADRVAEERMLNEVQSDVAGNDPTAWSLLSALRDQKRRLTQNEDGGQEVVKGYWKKDVGKIAEAVAKDTGSAKNKEIAKQITEFYQDLDDFEGSDAAFFDHALQQAQALVTDIYKDQHREYNEAMLAEMGESGKQMLRNYFKGGYWYINPEMKRYIEQYIGSYADFRKTMNANGIRVTTVDKQKRSGSAYDLEYVWKAGDESGLYEKLGGEDTDSVGDILQKAYDAVLRDEAEGSDTLTMEEYALAGKIGMSVVADYLQAGAKVITTHSVEKIDDQHHRETVEKLEKLKSETEAQRDQIRRQTEQIGQLNGEIETLRSTVSKEISRYGELSRQFKELKQNGAPMAEISQAKADMKAAMDAQLKAQEDLKKAQQKAEKQQQTIKDLRAQLKKTERAYDYAMDQLEDVGARRTENVAALEAKLREQYRMEYRDKIKEARARMKATQNRTKAVESIRKTGATLKKWMEHPDTNRGYFQQENAAAAADLIEALMKNDGRKSAAKVSRRLEEAIRQARESTDYRTSAMFDEGVNEDMREVTRLLEEKGSLRNLSDSDLEFVNGTLKTIEHQIRTANETIGRQKNQALSDESADMIKVSRENPQGMKGIGRLIRKGILTHLNPQRYFAIMGHHGNNAWTRLGDDLSEAQRKANKLNMDMTKNYEGLTQGENEKKFDKHTGKNATWYDTGIHILNEDGSDSGRTWKMNGGMRAYFALAWGSEQNREGMRAGMKNEQGQELYQLTIPDEELMKKGNQKEAYARGERVYFTEADAKAIIGEVTGYEQSWMNSWRDMEKLSKNAINETSLLLNGFRKATVDNYVPIFRDPRYIGKEFETVVTDSRLTSMGFLKERVNAHNPMMLMDLTDVIKRQVRDVSTYYGFAVPVRNATRIYNGNMPGYAASVKEVINKTQGMEVEAYFEKLMADLQGGSRVESSPLDKLRGNVAGAVLSGNPSVIIKQAASYPAAASVLGWKPLLKGLKYFNPAGLKGINVDKIDQYTSALWERRSRSLSDLEANANRNTRMSKTMHWLTNGIQGMDVATTKVIWKAAEYYVDEHNPDLSRGTDEYNRAVARIYEQALEGTQPEYGTMQRPGILRSQSQIVKSLTMYKTQSLQNFNILVDAATNLSDKAKAAKANNSEENQAALKAAKRQMATALSSQITSAVILGVMTAVGKALLHKLGGYRDDKGDLTAESVGGQILKDSASSVAGMVAGGSELFDLINGLIEGQSPFDIEAAGVSTINDLYQNTYAMLDAMKVIGDGDLTDAQKMSQMWPKMRKMGLSVAQLLGIPAGNFMNLIDGIAANAADFATGKPGSFASGSPLQIAGTPIIGSAQGRETSNKSVAGYIAQAMMDGDEAEAMRLYNEQIRQGKSVDALNSAIASWQKANIPEIKQAAEAIDNGDLSLYNQLINELTGKGLSMTNAVKYVEAERKKMTAEPKKEEEASGALTYQQILSGMTKETKTSEDNSYTNGMMNSLLEDGNVQAAMAVRDDMLANGKTKSSISSSLSSFWKPRLQEAYEAGDMVTVRQITQMLVQMGLKHTTIQEWTSSTGTSSSSSSSKKSSFGSGSFGGGSFGNSKKSSSKKSSFGSGSFGGKGFGK